MPRSCATAFRCSSRFGLTGAGSPARRSGRRTGTISRRLWPVRSSPSPHREVHPAESEAASSRRLEKAHQPVGTRGRRAGGTPDASQKAPGDQAVRPLPATPGPRSARPPPPPKPRRLRRLGTASACREIAHAGTRDAAPSGGQTSGTAPAPPCARPRQEADPSPAALSRPSAIAGRTRWSRQGPRRTHTAPLGPRAPTPPPLKRSDSAETGHASRCRRWSAQPPRPSMPWSGATGFAARAWGRVTRPEDCGLYPLEAKRVLRARRRRAAGPRCARAHRGPSSQP